MTPPPKPPTTMPPPPSSGAKTTAKPKINTPKLCRFEPVFRPPKIVFHAVEGWGKTTCGTYTPNPAIIMAKGETGYKTLLGSGLIPGCDAVDIDGWEELLGFLLSLDGKHTIVLDAIGGFERMCHQYVCDNEYDGDWGEQGFTSYQKGYDVAIPEWLKLLSILENLNNKGSIILMLSHTKIKTVPNTKGPDYSQNAPDIHNKTSSVTMRWADAVLFGTFLSIVETTKAKKPEILKKGKGIGGENRIIYTQHHDSHIAKNRYGMNTIINIPDNPSKIWETIWSNIKKG